LNFGFVIWDSRLPAPEAAGFGGQVFEA